MYKEFSPHYSFSWTHTFSLLSPTFSLIHISTFSTCSLNSRMSRASSNPLPRSFDALSSSSHLAISRVDRWWISFLAGWCFCISNSPNWETNEGFKSTLKKRNSNLLLQPYNPCKNYHTAEYSLSLTMLTSCEYGKFCSHLTSGLKVMTEMKISKQACLVAYMKIIHNASNTIRRKVLPSHLF